MKLSSLATVLWNLPKLIEKRLNLGFSQRQAVLFSTDIKEIITNFIRYHDFDARSERNLRAELKRENYGLRDLRGYLMSIWDRNNFLLFALTIEDCIAAYVGPVAANGLDFLVGEHLQGPLLTHRCVARLPAGED